MFSHDTSPSGRAMKPSALVATSTITFLARSWLEAPEFIRSALVKGIGGMRDALQLSVIQPVQVAVLAIGDDHLAGSGVEMRIHRPVAMRTGQLPLQFIEIGLSRNHRALCASANGVNQSGEGIHGDQHAAAALAVAQ